MAAVSSHSSSPNPHNNEFEMVDGKTARFEIGEKANELPSGEAIVDRDPDFQGTKSTADDRLAMQRLGKKQQLIVCGRLPTHPSSNRAY